MLKFPISIEKDVNANEFLAGPSVGLVQMTTAPLFPANPISVTEGNIQVMKRLQKKLTTAYPSIKIQKYLISQNGWNATLFDMIDWTNIEQAMGRESINFWV